MILKFIRSKIQSNYISWNGYWILSSSF